MNPLYFNFTITLFISSWVLYTFVYIKLHEMEIMIELPLWTFHFLLYDFFSNSPSPFLTHIFYIIIQQTTFLLSSFFSRINAHKQERNFFLSFFLLLLLPYHCRRLVAKNKLKFMIGLCTEASFVHIEQKSNC